jgi:hypothetical protein
VVNCLSLLSWQHLQGLCVLLIFAFSLCYLQVKILEFADFLPCHYLYCPLLQSVDVVNVWLLGMKKSPFQRV